MQKLLDRVEKKLNCLSLSELKKLLKKHDEWFNFYEDFAQDKAMLDDRKALKTKKQIVKWIMNTDPIFVDGGLLHFLYNKSSITQSWTMLYKR